LTYFIKKLVSKATSLPGARNQSSAVNQLYRNESDVVDARGIARCIGDVEFAAYAGRPHITHAPVWLDGSERVVGDWYMS